MKVINKTTKIFLIIIIAWVVVAAVYWLGIRKLLAKNSLKSTLTAMTTGDYTEGFYYVDNGSIKKYLDTSELGYLTIMNSQFDIKECSLSWNSIEANVVLSVKYPNIFGLFNELYADVDTEYSSEEISKTLIKAINSASNMEYCEKNIEVNIVQYGTKWYLIENEALMDVYSGGLYSEYKKVLFEKLEE